MRKRVAAPLQQALVVLGCLRRQGEEARERVGLLGMTALGHQRLGMVGVGNVLVALVGTDMAGDEVLVAVDA